MNVIARKYIQRAKTVHSLLCVGLDPDIERMPERFRDETSPLFAFSRFIIDATAPYVAAFKPNSAFYEAFGAHGFEQLQQTCDYLRLHHPDVVLICDAKRADIGNTNRGYVSAVFDHLGCDAITLHPYLGREALQPFLARTDKACIVLCRTSNTGAGEFQDLEIDGTPLWQIVAEKVTRQWDEDGNCMLVVGATYPEEMRRLRALAPHTIFLVPGIGAQGGDIQAVVDAGLDVGSDADREAQGGGLILSCSRDILYADNPAAAARNFRDEINAAVRVRGELILAAR